MSLEISGYGEVRGVGVSLFAIVYQIDSIPCGVLYPATGNGNTRHRAVPIYRCGTVGEGSSEVVVVHNYISYATIATFNNVPTDIRISLISLGDDSVCDGLSIAGTLSRLQLLSR